MTAFQIWWVNAYSLYCRNEMNFCIFTEHQIYKNRSLSRNESRSHEKKLVRTFFCKQGTGSKADTLAFLFWLRPSAWRPDWRHWQPRPRRRPGGVASEGWRKARRKWTCCCCRSVDAVVEAVERANSWSALSWPLLHVCWGQYRMLRRSLLIKRQKTGHWKVHLLRRQYDPLILWKRRYLMWFWWIMLEMEYSLFYGPLDSAPSNMQSIKCTNCNAHRLASFLQS